MSGRLKMHLIVGLVGIAAWAGSAAAATGADRIVVYYFHRTLRCQTCLAIEELATFAITQNLFAEIERGELAWRPVNVDKEADAHFVDDFELETQALVVASYQDGEVTRWRNLEKVWDLHPTPDAFDAYVLANVREFLKDAGATSTQPAVAR